MTTGAETRHAWADVARGICVLLVVAMHVHQLLYAQWFEAGKVTAAWDALVSATQPFRMPLFFLISGYLATRAVKRPWRDVARPRVWSILYLYVLWLVVFVAVRVLRAQVEGTHVPWSRYASEFLWPQSTLWYLYALVLYFVVVKVTLRVPLAVVLAVGALASVAATTFLGDSTLQYVLRCFVFFMLGARVPQLLDAVIARSSWGRLMLAGLAYAGAAAFTLWAGKNTVGLVTVTGVVGIIAMLWLSKLIAPSRVASPLRYIGRNTLAIFVLHPILISLCFVGLLLAPALANWVRSEVPIVAVLPVMLLAAITAASLVLESLLKSAGLGFLFRLPARGPAPASPTPR